MWPEDLILGILRKRRQRRQGLHSKTQVHIICGITNKTRTTVQALNLHERIRN